MSNFAYIGGVVKAPIYFDNDYLCIDLEIYRADLKKSEFLTVKTKNPYAVTKATDKVQEGQYFLTTEAHLKTIPYIRIKEMECSECFYVKSQKVKSERTEVVFEDFTIMKIDNPEAAYGINKVFLDGNICSPLNYREKDGKAYCKYKMAVNDTIYDSLAEYPYVVTFGRDAELSHKYLKEKSQVFVEGSIQERTIKQNAHFICPDCGTEADKKIPNIVREVIVSNVLFLNKENHLDE